MSFDPIAYINKLRWRASKYGLHRIRALMKRLGNPQESLKFVHVAGTNGKGSTCAFLSSILTVAGFKTGMFTSPYLFNFKERIQVNGKNIAYEDLTAVTLLVRDAAEAVEAELGEHPTEFELMTAVALIHFAQVKCDIVVLEVGLGGALDSTNVIPAPEVCVITRIGLDHTALLGDTLEAIACEKAGIIKPGAVVVKQDDAPEVLEAIEDVAKTQGCAMRVAEAKCGSICENEATGALLRTFEYDGKHYETLLIAKYQAQNAACALAAIDALREKGWEISDDAITQGVRQTTWPARFEIVSNSPTIVVDGSHNAQGIQALVDTLQDVFPDKKAVFIMSVLADKDYPSMVRTFLPRAQALIAFTPPNSRALSAEKLVQEVQAASCELCENSHDGQSITQCNAIPSTAATSAEGALGKARVLAGKKGLIVVCGSLYSIADVMRAIRNP